MCGLVGYAARRAPADASWLARGSESISHRGPDGAGCWLAPDMRVGLAQRRLAVIDLSPGGHQPMLDANAARIIVFNGEIYNFRELRAELMAQGHVFRSQSDTEVVLAAYRAWGEDMLPRLNGMFALALYDASRQRLLLARDRAGEKPLFYRFADGEVRFASELKALLADPSMPRAVDPLGLDCYLAAGYAPGELCLLQGYRKLPPAHRMVFDLTSGALDISRWWEPPPLEAGAEDLDDVELLQQLQDLLQDSVARQLVADVPVGVLLSGGVDSSIVTALAAKASSRVRTFTVAFGGFGSHDESAHARLVASHFGTEHFELQAGEAGPELLPMLARQYDEPIIDSSMLPTYLVSRLVRQHCTVALGGDGGDELFGGYTHHGRIERLRQLAGWVPIGLRRAAAGMAGSLLPTGFKGRNWLQAVGADFERDVPWVAGHFDMAARRSLLPGLRVEGTGANAVLAARVARGPMDVVQRATRTDFANYLPEDILVKVDRASMLASLELRAPMLDHRIIEFAFGRVPSRLKTDGIARKILLRRLAAGMLPANFDVVRKQGFSIPLGTWLRRGPWREMLRDELLDPGSVFDRRKVKALLDHQDRGAGNHERLFGLVLFELWRREYRCTL